MDILHKLDFFCTMKQRILLFALAVVMLAGCQDEQKRFCVQASNALCDRCQSCGDFKACGLNRVTSKEDCAATLQSVCAAYDSLYSGEVARTCLQGIESLSCEQLKSSGKPDVCTRLF